MNATAVSVIQQPMTPIRHSPRFGCESCGGKNKTMTQQDHASMGWKDMAAHHAECIGVGVALAAVGAFLLRKFLKKPTAPTPKVDN